MLAFGNLFAFTSYFLVSRRVREKVRPWAYVAGMTTVAGLLIAVTTVGLGEDLGLPGGWDIFFLATLAIFPGTLGHVLTNWAHAHVTAFSISMILLAAPLVASAAAWVFLGESITTLQALGGGVVLCAIGAIVWGADEAVGGDLADSAAEGEAP